MKPTLTIIDNASAVAGDLRNFALQHCRFETVRYDDHDYAGISTEVPEGVMESVIRRIPGMRNAVLRMEFLRRNSIRDPVESWIHADGGIADTAVVWYLSPDEHCVGGTAFYRHRRTGWQSMPTVEQMAKEKMTVEETSKMLLDDSHTEEAWDRLMIVPARFNRMILYPAKDFHGKYPKQGFGTDDENSRLIYVAFLNR